MKALLCDQKGKSCGVIALPNCAPTPSVILQNKRAFFNETEGLIFQARPFLVAFDDGSRVLYDAEGEKVWTRTKGGMETYIEYQVKTKASVHPAPSTEGDIL